ncbi:MAG: iron-containing alcohol dehydrogenase [Candidatus Bathyarchaeia archaeon]
MRVFLSPKVLFGRDALTKLADEVRGKGSKAVIVTDKIMVKLGLAEKIGGILKDAGYETMIFDEVEPDPSIQLVKRGAEMLGKFQPQWIIGLGGGSAIDTGKAMWILYERPEYMVSYLPEAVTPGMKLGLRRKARYVSIPTTSGTGADVSWCIVLSDTDTRRKIPFSNHEIVPDISVLDPELPLTMPKEITAITGMDVLTHAVEGYVSRWANDFSDGLCLQAVRMTFEWLPKAYHDGEDLEAREKMHNAATIAGLGFGNSNTALAHSLGHPLGAVFRIPHGRAVGIALPYTTQFNAPASAERYAEIARFVGIDARSAKEATQKLVEKMKALLGSIDEPTSLKQIGIHRKDMEENMPHLVSTARLDGSTPTNPRRPTEYFEKLLWHIWEGKDVDF